MVKIAFELPEGPLAALHQDTATFSRELRIVAAVKWYEMQKLSQARAAEVAGLAAPAFGWLTIATSTYRPVEIPSPRRRARGTVRLGSRVSSARVMTSSKPRSISDCEPPRSYRQYASMSARSSGGKRCMFSSAFSRCLRSRVRS